MANPKHKISKARRDKRRSHLEAHAAKSFPLSSMSGAETTACDLYELWNLQRAKPLLPLKRDNHPFGFHTDDFPSQSHENSR